AVGGVVVDERDLLAFEAAAVFLQQVIDRDRGRVPVVGRIVEDPFEDLAVGSRGAAVARRVERNVAGGDRRDQLVAKPGRERVRDRRANALGRLVALLPLLGVVGGLALGHDDLLAADAAVALVQQGEVVVEAVGIG